MSIFKEYGLANHLILFGHLIAFAEEYGYDLINPTFKPYSGFFYSTRRSPYCAYPFARRWPSRMVKARLSREMAGASRAGNYPGHSTERSPTSASHDPISPEGPHQPDFGELLRAAFENPDAVPTASGAVTVLHEGPREPYTSLEASEILAKINDSQITFMVGWGFRAMKCVQKHAEKIRRCFRPVENYVHQSTATVNRLRQESDIVVGVHVRHGDYREWLDGKNFHPASQYATWMHQVREQFSHRKVSFFVCSDEQRTHREFPGLRIAFGCPNSPLGDLYGLAQCDYIFGPASTFSLWASFYGKARLRFVGSHQDGPNLTTCKIATL